MPDADADADATKNRTDPPFDPRTGRAGYRVTIKYTSNYGPNAQFVEGDVNPHLAEIGHRVAIYDAGNARTLAITPAGLVYSHKSETSRIGMGGRVINVEPQSRGADQ